MVGSSAALAAIDLTVSYGSSRGIVGIDLEIPEVGVTGLLGPNGAGKSTLLRAALDLVHPTSGEIRVLGLSSRDPRARAEVVYLPGELLLPARLTGWSVLRRFTAGRGHLDVARVRALAARLDLDLERRVGQLSKGNRQKIGLVLAFAPRARLLLLDEPTSGLDPLLQREFATLVAETVAEGAAVMLSSHVLSELEGLADRVAVLRSGELVAFESTSMLRSRARSSLQLVMADEYAARSLEADLQGFARVQRDGARLDISYSGDVDRIIKAAAGYRTTSIDKVGGDLDDVLMDFYAEGESA